MVVAAAAAAKKTAPDPHILGESRQCRPVSFAKACSPRGILDRLRPTGSDSDSGRAPALDEVHGQDGWWAIAFTIKRCLGLKCKPCSSLSRDRPMRPGTR